MNEIIDSRTRKRLAFRFWNLFCMKRNSVGIPFYTKDLPVRITLRQRGIMSLERPNPGGKSCKRHFFNTFLRCCWLRTAETQQNNRLRKKMEHSLLRNIHCAICYKMNRKIRQQYLIDIKRKIEYTKNMNKRLRKTKANTHRRE